MRKNWGLILFLLILFGLSLFNGIIGLWMDWLWFEETTYTILFSTRLATRVLLIGVGGLIFFLVIS